MITGRRLAYIRNDMKRLKRLLRRKVLKGYDEALTQQQFITWFGRVRPSLVNEVSLNDLLEIAKEVGLEVKDG